MACAGLLLISVLAAGAPDVADVVHQARETSPPPSLSQPPPNRPIDLSVRGAMHNPAISPSEANADSGMPQSDHWNDGARPGFSLGPLRAEFGGVTGRRMHLATVRLEGVSVFGGSVGASLGSRSAKITLSWPTAPN